MQNPILLVVTLLNIGVIIVNGATDAPNAIATAVSTRAMKPRHAIIMAAVFNFLGLLLVSLVSTAVAHTIFSMVDFGGNSHQALTALMAAMVAIIVWGAAAWWFGIPTSQSHSLIAGLTARPSRRSGWPGRHQRRRVDEGRLRHPALHAARVRPGLDQLQGHRPVCAQCGSA